MKYFSYLVLLTFTLSCAQVTSLNLKKHQFGKIPTKIVWIQVAGLSPEHISLLKFSNPSRDRKTAFENSLCVGSAWDYNLFDLRPKAYSGFLSQLTGKKNIKNQCEDYRQKPIWKYLAGKNYKIGIFEGESYKTQSLLQHKQCKKSGAQYLSEAKMWSMNKVKSPKFLFHINEKDNYKSGKTYYDKSCLKEGCYTSFSRNVETIYKRFERNSKNNLFIVQNFKYLNLLQKKKIKEARAELIEIDSVLNFFQSLSRKSNDMLVLLTSAEVKELNFPKTGEAWKRFEKKPRLLGVKNTKLISSVFASGARAENFCGIYDQSQILSRIFSGAKQQGLEFSIINPFE